MPPHPNQEFLIQISRLPKVPENCSPLPLIRKGEAVVEVDVFSVAVDTGFFRFFLASAYNFFGRCGEGADITLSLLSIASEERSFFLLALSAFAI